MHHTRTCRARDGSAHQLSRPSRQAEIHQQALGGPYRALPSCPDYPEDEVSIVNAPARRRAATSRSVPAFHGSAGRKDRASPRGRNSGFRHRSAPCRGRQQRRGSHGFALRFSAGAFAWGPPSPRSQRRADYSAAVNVPGGTSQLLQTGSCCSIGRGADKAGRAICRRATRGEAWRRKPGVQGGCCLLRDEHGQKQDHANCTKKNLARGRPRGGERHRSCVDELMSRIQQ